jgi:alpha-tubulin suppressor-like RCC1 family protein
MSPDPTTHARRRRPTAVPAVLAGAVMVALASPAGAAPLDQATHWGSFFGNGSSHNDQLLTPTVVDLPGRVVEVATSNSTQYALMANGSVYAWGLGGAGQLGDGATADSFTTAVRVAFPTGVTIASLPTDAMPYNTGLAIDTAGNAWGWGLNGGGELCLGNDAPALVPVEVPLDDVTLASGAGDHTLFDTNGTVVACGANSYGQLGDGTTVSSRRAVTVLGLADQSVEALVTSASDSGALLADGTYLDWGYDGGGQLGDGVIGTNSSVPVTVSLPHPVTQVAQGASSLGNGQTLTLLSDGTLWAWGDDQFGQLGDDRRTTEPAPVQFSAPTGVTYTALATGADTSYAVSSTGVLYSWGDGAQGQLGNGGRSTALAPVAVASGVGLLSATALDVAAAR